MLEMLTISQAADKLRKLQPQTPIGEKALRKWQKEARFHSVTSGRRILISWESLYKFLNGDIKEA